MIINSKTDKLLRSISRVASFLLHPFLVPFYVLIVLMHTDSMTMLMSHNVKIYITKVILVHTLFIPAFAIILLRMLRVIENYSLSTRRERVLPLIIIIVCNVVCTIILWRVFPLLIWYKIMAASTVCAAAVFIINMYWQISMHMTAMGGAVGVMTILMLAGNIKLMIPLCIGILLSGILGFSRLYLGKHDLAQVAAGFMLNFLISAIMVMIA